MTISSIPAFDFGPVDVPPLDPSEMVRIVDAIVADLNAGRRDAALAAIGRLVPRRFDALPATLVGLCSLAAGAPAVALTWLDAALVNAPMMIEAMKGRATALTELGRNPEAHVAFVLAFAAGCDDPAAHYNHGNVLRQMDLRDAAIEAYDKALRLQPAFPEALRAGGAILAEGGRRDDALRFVDEAIRLRPDYLDAILDRANILEQMDRIVEALETLDVGLVHLPAQAQLLNNKGVMLFRLGRLDDALVCLDQAIACDGALAQAYLNKGEIEVRQGRFDDALVSLDAAIALRPVYTEAHCARGVALKLSSRFDEARAAFDRALSDDPASVYARTNLGELKLLLGDFEDGWRDYDFRFLTRGHDRPVLAWPVPEWAGQQNPGRVLVVADQAAGDVIHFARYIPLIRDVGAAVTLVCRPRMQRLLRHVSEGCELMAQMPEAGAFDYQIPLSNAPYACRTTLTNMPSTPYIFAEPELREAWRAKLGPGSLKVGLCWRGSQDFRSDPKRSVPLECLRGLADIPGVRLVSLQMSDNLGVDRDALAAMSIEVPEALDAGPHGFIETAALMASLDLVVSCDTSIAHLAGALGRPTFVLLQKVPEWRFLLDRDDCPWYPSMRVFRQVVQDRWDEPVAKLSAAISVLAAATLSARG